VWNLSGTSVNGLSPDWRSKGRAEENDDVACPNRNSRVSGDLNVVCRGLLFRRRSILLVVAE